MAVALLLGTWGKFLADADITIYVDSLDVLRCLGNGDSRGASTTVECLVANAYHFAAALNLAVVICLVDTASNPAA